MPEEGIPQDPQGQLAIAKALWGFEPHAGGQLDWFLDLSPRKAGCCGRQWGKSYIEAVDKATYALRFPGCKQSIIAPVGAQTEMIFTEIEKLLLTPKVPFGQKIHIKHDPSGAHIWIGKPGVGSWIKCLSANPMGDAKNKRGWQFHRMDVDEAAQVDGSIIRMVFEPMLMRYNGQICQISTPNGMNSFHDTCQNYWKASGKRHHYPSESNPYLSRVFLEAKRKELGETSLTWRQEYMAEFVANVNEFFYIPHIERAFERASRHPHEPIKGHRYVAGVDFAASEDWTVVVIIDATTPTFEVVFMDRFHRVEKEDNWDWSQQMERVALHLNKWDADTLTDATSVGESLTDILRKRAGRVQGIGLNHYTQGQRIIHNLRMKFDANEIILPHPDSEEGKVANDELRHFYERATEGMAMVKMGASKGHHDDFIYALGLACWKAGGYSYQTVEDRQTTMAESRRMMRRRDRQLEHNSAPAFALGKNF